MSWWLVIVQLLRCEPVVVYYAARVLMHLFLFIFVFRQAFRSDLDCRNGGILNLCDGYHCQVYYYNLLAVQTKLACTYELGYLCFIC